MTEGPLLQEAVWDFAVAMTGCNALLAKPVSLQLVKYHMKFFIPNARLIQVGRRIYYPEHLESIKQEIQRLSDEGCEEITSPWPGPNQKSATSWVWDLYSDAQLLERVNGVYTAALEAYQKLVNEWFSPLSEWFSLAILLPASLVGFLRPSSRTAHIESSPSLLWRLEPLPLGEQSCVNIRIADGAGFKSELNELSKDVSQLRPSRSEWVSAWEVNTAMSEMLELRPATELVYSWLLSDLSRICWTNRSGY